METLTYPPEAAPASLPDAEAPSPIPPECELALRRLLDGPYGGQGIGNYESARDSGLLDLFYYDSETGQDAIEHILSGNIVRGENGAQLPEGFHHEPSGAFGAAAVASEVDRSHLQTANNGDRRNYREFPFEPYRAQVSIAGMKKMAVRLDKNG